MTAADRLPGDHGHANSYWTHGTRHDLNEASRAYATRCSSPWTQDEIELLLTWDRTETELDTMALILERTREACRVKYYLEWRVRHPDATVTVTKTTTVQYRYSNWSEEDQSPWYV